MTMTKITLLAATALAGTGAAQAADWTAYTYSSVSTTAAVQGMNRIVERVAEETDGELDITLHLGGTLQINSSDITQAVGDGILDFGADFFFSGSVPIARVLNLPLLISNDEEWAAAYEAMEPYLEEAFAGQGTVYLGGYRYPQQTIFTTFEISEPSDLEGRRIRVTSPEQGRFIEEFGGGGITLSGSEVPTSLERGVIDGVLTASAGGAKNWGEFLPYNYRFAVNYGNSAIIANADAFDSLPQEQQDALRSIVEEEGPAITQAFLEDEDVQMEAQQEAGMTIVQPEEGAEAEARAAMEPYWTEWAEDNGPEYVEALQAVRDAIGR